MLAEDMDAGLHFTPHIANHYSVPQLGDLGELAYRRGFDQLWVNDNLGYRNLFVVLSAIAARAPIRLGSGIAVPYFRNPVDMAGTVASLAELSGADRFSLGLGRGSPHLVGETIVVSDPYRVLRETAQLLDELLAGGSVNMDGYPALSDYFGFKPSATVSMAFEPEATVEYVMGGFGETAMTVAGKFMDGTLVIGLPYLELGMVEPRLAIADGASNGGMNHVLGMPVSIAEDREDAYEFPKPYVAHRMIGSANSLLSDEQFRELGIDPSDVADLRRTLRGGAKIDEATDLVTDAMVEAMFVVGTPESTTERLDSLLDLANSLDFSQLSFTHLGPDYELTIDFLAEKIGLR